MADLLNTIPARLAIMARDAHAEIRFASDKWQQNLDAVKRTAALIDLPESDTPSISTGLANPVQAFDIALLGKLVADVNTPDEAAETDIRQMVEAVMLYIRRRPRLAFSNTLEHEAATLGDLAGVIHTTLRRGRVGLVVPETELPYWGGVIHCLVDTLEDIEEVLV